MQKTFKTLLALAFLAAPWVVKAQTTTLTYTFTQPAELIASAGSDEVICNGETVTLNGGETGGTGPFSYLWSPSSGLSDITIADPDADPTDTTTYTIVITDANNCTAADDVTIFVDTCTAVTNLQGVASVTLYPNPNKGNFRVNASLEKGISNFRLTIVNMAGQEIYSSTRNTPAVNFTEEVSLPGISRGMYTVRMDFDGAVLERKIVVQ